MYTLKWFRFILLLAIVSGMGFSARSQVILGDAPLAPTNLSGLPGAGPHPNVLGGSFGVDTSSREQVRQFYNAVYTSSTGVPINSSAIVGSCVSGTNSTAFANAILLRINWFRAMAGIPASVTFDTTESAKDQAAAVMMAEHGALQHVGNWTGWNCVSANGTNASGNSNLALGNYGPDAINAYILDYGASNYEVGHRRWILYPQTKIMATGDVPPQGSYYSANATWVFDANYGGARPATRTPYVAWPPAGYVPYQVVYPQWSFSLSNANLSASTVTMASNGVAVPVTRQSYVTGYGENTLVWYPTSLDPNNGTSFPFGATDTVYSITISNVTTPVGVKNYSYNVTLFDPATIGPDYSPLVITGPNQQSVNTSNLYSCTSATNPYTTGYQWLAAQATNGNLVDLATNGLVNFIMSPTPIYSIITNPPTGSGNCFHLSHPVGVPQLLQLNRMFFPSNTSTLSFKSLLGYAMPTQVARVQASTDGGATWQDLYTQPGSGGSGDPAFTLHTVSLTNYAGKSTFLRFNYDFLPGSFYPQTSSFVGWCLENIIVTNCQQLLNQTTNSTSSTNFFFTPSQTGSYVLQARGVIYSTYPGDFGIAKSVMSMPGVAVINVNAPTISSNQVKVNFSLAGGSTPGFHLLQSARLYGPWATNAGAVLTTNVLGSSYQFTATNASPVQFFRVVTP